MRLYFVMGDDVSLIVGFVFECLDRRERHSYTIFCVSLSLCDFHGHSHDHDEHDAASDDHPYDQDSKPSGIGQEHVQGPLHSSGRHAQQTKQEYTQRREFVNDIIGNEAGVMKMFSPPPQIRYSILSPGAEISHHRDTRNTGKDASRYKDTSVYICLVLFEIERVKKINELYACDHIFSSFS